MGRSQKSESARFCGRYSGGRLPAAAKYRSGMSTARRKKMTPKVMSHLVLIASL